MTMPPPRAYVLLREKMDSYNEAHPPDAASVAGWRFEFGRYLDADMAAATTHEQELKLKALSVGGAYMFDQMGDGGSKTGLETFNDMVGLATGERGNTNLDPVRPRRSQRSAQQDFSLACAIVALGYGYDQHPGFVPWVRNTTDKTVKQIRKIVDNMEQERGPYEAVRTNIEDIRRLFQQGEDWMFSDLKG